MAFVRKLYKNTPFGAVSALFIALKCMKFDITKHNLMVSIGKACLLGLHLWRFYVNTTHEN